MRDRRPTRPELLEYVASLPAEMQEVFRLADRFALCAADTLDEGFQVAADVLGASEARAGQKLGQDHQAP